jgi:hypothetical protein
MQYVRFKHRYSEKRIGEMPVVAWDQKRLNKKFDLYWIEVDRYEKSEYEPEEVFNLKKKKNDKNNTK